MLEAAEEMANEMNNNNSRLIRVEVMSGVLIIGMGYMITLLHSIPKG